jgi:formate dehydrogenase major subunit
MEAATPATLALMARTDGTQIARSVCPFCGVGCGQLVFHRDGALVAIEGDPASPINAGTLCPKGAASHQLLTHALRLQRVLYRAPGAKAWQPLALDEALDMVAERVWASRERTFIAHDGDRALGHTTAIAHLGGATLDNEENYLIKKLFTGGLGLVAVSNQARI